MKKTWKQRLFGIPEKETRFDTRGYERCDPRSREFLERIIREFAAGYHLALNSRDADALVESLDNGFDDHHVGFAYEGSGMYFGLLDFIFPWGPSRLQRFADRVSGRHDFIVMVGAGFAVGRLPWGPILLDRYMRKIEPMKAWCVPDGYGFHQGIFHHEDYIDRCKAPPLSLPEFAKQLFDSGIGRSMWWVKGSSPERISQAISRFPAERQAELWCGIGVACTYAGGVDEDALLRLRDSSGPYLLDFLSGIPFAARMRHDGNNGSHWTRQACRVLLNQSMEEASDITKEVLKALRPERMDDEEIRINSYAYVREGLMNQIRELLDCSEGRQAATI